MENKTIMLNKIRNERAKIQLKMFLLQCSSEILKEYIKNPEIFKEIYEELQISEKRFFSYISEEPSANISFYDQTLRLIKERKKQ